MTSFALHYVWENLQCPLFFVHENPAPMQWAMVQATVGDVMMTWVVQGILALSSRSWLWMLEKWTLWQWSLMVGMALVFSTAVELNALRSDRWSYTEINPMLPGLGISVIPMAQLILLFPSSFGLCRWLMTRISARKEQGL